MIRAGTVDVLFGNEDEVRHLTGCDTLNDCIADLSKDVGTLVITRGAPSLSSREKSRPARRGTPVTPK